MPSGTMPGRYPAAVKSYDAAKRTCRVEIPGLTDGGDVFPEAEIEYPIGDKAKSGEHSTEIALEEGDTVWVAFIGGDPRHPIITGHRNPGTGNGTDWRRFHHANIELLADQVARVKAATVELDTGTGIKGVVQGDCICPYTRSPHVMVSATVKAGR